MTVKDFWGIIKRAGADLINDRVFRMSAALAYYTVFSLAPRLIVIITLCDVFYGQQVIEGRVYAQIKDVVGQEAAVQIQDIIRRAILYLNHSWIARVTGFAALVFGATSVFSEIQDALNYIWRVKVKQTSGWLRVLLNRLLSFSMVLSLGFILLVSLVLDALMAALSAQLSRVFPQLAVIVAHSLNLVLTFCATFLLFGTIFKVLPDVKIRWRDVTVGAFTTALLFMSGRFGIGYYLHLTHIDTSYGAAGSIVVVLLWVYYSALILYFGAEFTREYAQFRGRRIYPNDYAVWIRQVEVEDGEAAGGRPAQRGRSRRSGDRTGRGPGGKRNVRGWTAGQCAFLESPVSLRALWLQTNPASFRRSFPTPRSMDSSSRAVKYMTDSVRYMTMVPGEASSRGISGIIGGTA